MEPLQLRPARHRHDRDGCRHPGLRFGGKSPEDRRAAPVLGGRSCRLLCGARRPLGRQALAEGASRMTRAAAEAALVCPLALTFRVGLASRPHGAPRRATRESRPCGTARAVPQGRTVSERRRAPEGEGLAAAVDALALTPGEGSARLLAANRSTQRPGRSGDGLATRCPIRCRDYSESKGSQTVPRAAAVLLTDFTCWGESGRHYSLPLPRGLARNRRPLSLKRVSRSAVRHRLAERPSPPSGCLGHRLECRCRLAVAGAGKGRRDRTGTRAPVSLSTWNE